MINKIKKQNNKNALAVELAFFNKKKKEFLKYYNGKYLLIKGKKLYGSFDTFENALKAGYDLLGVKEPMLIKRVLEHEIPIFIPTVFFSS